MEELKQAIARTDDLIRRVDRTWQDGLSDFMPRPLAQDVLDAFRTSPLFLHPWGGYEEAERLRLLVRPDNQPPEMEDFGICLLVYRTKDPSFQADHRDYLGALMALGFARGKTGDLLAYDDGCDVLCDRDFAPFFQQTPLEVRGRTLQLEICELNHWQPPERAFDEKVVSVDSMRLDAILARAFNLSRGRAKDAIAAGLVQLNNRVTFKSTELLEPGMSFSCRGQGKGRLVNILGKTRKGKTRVSLWIYR